MARAIVLGRNAGSRGIPLKRKLDRVSSFDTYPCKEISARAIKQL
jgi:hypothetical protein